MNRTRFFKRIPACLLCLALIALMIPATEERVFARDAKEKTISGLGTGTIGNPAVPKDGNSPWTGSYVYYGTFDKNYDYNTVPTYPVRYRVLDKDTTVFSTGKTEADKAHTMLLDCDSVLYSQPMDDNMTPNVRRHMLNEWAISDIAGHVPRDTTEWEHNDIPSLNDENNGFIAKSFTAMEQAAITFSSKEKKAKGDGNGEPPYDDPEWGMYGSVFTPLNNDRIFFLDAVELTRESYGYLNASLLDDPDVKESTYPFLSINCRIKKKAVEGYDWSWWMRSSYINGELTDRFGIVLDDGNFDNMWANQDWAAGVSPTFNLDLKRILFSSKIDDSSAGDDEYKLTIKDDSLKISVSDGKEAFLCGDRKTVVVPYTLTNDLKNGSKATKVSVLILKEKYVPGKTVVNTGSETNYYYMKLDTLSGFKASGAGTFCLPEEYVGKTCGRDFFVYILAEDENGKNMTDYASEPVEIFFNAPEQDIQVFETNDNEGNVINTALTKHTNPDGSSHSYGISKDDKNNILSYIEERTGTEETGNLRVDSFVLNVDGSSEKTMVRTYLSGNLFTRKTLTDSEGNKTVIRKLIKKTINGNISVRIKTFDTKSGLESFKGMILKPNGKVFEKEVTVNADGTENIKKTTKKLDPALTDVSAAAGLLE